MRGVRFLGAAVFSVFLAALATPSFGGVPEGKKAFEAKKCGECHQIQGPAKEKTIKDQLAKKGPELWYSGSKFKPDFLSSWLKDPKPIRPLEYYSLTKKNTGNHPKLNAKDAGNVADFLMSLKSNDVKEPVQAKDNPKGKQIFIKKMACYGCHEVKAHDTVAGGLSGPSLIGASERLQADWIYAYLSNPKVFKPVNDMPNYNGYLNEAEMKDVAAYVGSLE